MIIKIIAIISKKIKGKAAWEIPLMVLLGGATPFITKTMTPKGGCHTLFKVYQHEAKHHKDDKSPLGGHRLLIQVRELMGLPRQRTPGDIVNI